MKIKFCGLRSRADIRAAIQSRAAYAGFVNFPRSPRHLSLADAKWVAEEPSEGLTRVMLSVDASDDDIAAFLEVLPVEVLQLHGGESPERVAELRAEFGGVQIWKAVALETEVDLSALDAYCDICDQILVDARKPPGAVLPGGNGVPFDWRLIEGRKWTVPWILAGGLTPTNVAEAIALTGARQVDVSTGVEIRPGIKDHARMAEFSANAIAADGQHRKNGSD